MNGDSPVGTSRQAKYCQRTHLAQYESIPESRIKLVVRSQIDLAVIGGNMTVKLDKEDYIKLSSVISRIEEFRTETDRLNFVSAAFFGLDDGRSIVSRISLAGAPFSAAMTLVRRLAEYGRVAPGQEALAVLIGHVLLYTNSSDPDSEFLMSLFGKYILEETGIPQPAIRKWQGQETLSSVLEGIIGENTLRPIAMLEMALDAARAVVHISRPNGLAGTGFVVAPGLIMTANHVVNEKELLHRYTFSFNYELDTHDNPKQLICTTAKRDGIFHTNSVLDFTILELSEGYEDVLPLRLKSEIVAENSRLAIIQHPGGLWKQISLQNNFVSFADEHAVQYTTSTLPGSSGSPVLDDRFDVVAIHHGSVLVTDTESKKQYLRNEGTSMVTILKYVRSHRPDIYERLLLV